MPGIFQTPSAQVWLIIDFVFRVHAGGRKFWLWSICSQFDQRGWNFPRTFNRTLSWLRHGPLGKLLEQMLTQAHI